MRQTMVQSAGHIFDIVDASLMYGYFSQPVELFVYLGLYLNKDKTGKFYN